MEGQEMELSSLLTAILAILIARLIVSYFLSECQCSKDWDSCKLPGPSKGTPFIGQLWNLVKSYKKPMVLYTNWAEKYGGIYKVKIGSKFVIVLSTAEWFSKVFAKTGTKLSYRVRDNVLALVIGNKGLVISDGDVWKHHRKFTVKAFRDLEIGKEPTHEVIFKQVTNVVQHVGNQIEKYEKISISKGIKNYKGYDAQLDIGVGFFNVLWHFLVGHTFPLKCPRIRDILLKTKVEMKVAEIGGPWNFSFLLRIIWITVCNPFKLLASYLRRRQLVNGEINYIKTLKKKLGKDSYCYNNNPSVVDMYIQSINDQTLDLCKLSDDNIGTYLSDLVVAGVETTYSSVRWALLFLAKNPKYMRKLQNELDEQLKCFSLYELTCYHKCEKELPYLEAVVAETLRIRPVVHTICHTTIEDLKIEDFQIPRGTWVIGNLWGVHHDKSIWKDPHCFRPERFLNKFETQISKLQVDKCLVFSTGPRKCIGVQLSRVQLHAFLVALCSNFNISVSNFRNNDINLDPQLGISLIPPECKLLFQKRKSSIIDTAVVV